MTTAQDFAALAGRLMLGAIFLWAGFGKAIASAGTIAYFQKLGLPMPMLAYALTVAVELGVGALFVLGVFSPWPAIVLGVWSIAVAFVGHADLADRGQVIHFLKNVGLCGGFLYAAALGPGRYSLHGLFGSRS